MGLPSDLANVASDSIPILLVALAAHGVCYIKSLLCCLLHAIGLSRFFPPTADHDALPGFAIVDEHANVSRRLYMLREEEEKEKNNCWVDGKNNGGGLDLGGGSSEECVVCLSGMRDGEQVRRLACCHVFHRACLDGWFDHQKTSCPLCRAPLPLPSVS
ncbi:Ring finger domain [Asimina triloba]